MRIRAQLIDGKADHHLWSETYDDIMDNIFVLQDRITGKIVSALAVKLTPGEQNRISEQGTTKPLSYDAYIKGMAHLMLWTPDNLARAFKYFKESVAEDPDNTHAYTALARAYLQNYQGGREFFKKTKVRGIDSLVLARHYINLSMKNPMPHTYILFALLEMQKHNFGKADELVEKAITLAPNDADILRIAGYYYIRADRAEKSLKCLEKSTLLDPLNHADRIKGGVYFVLGQYEKAAKHFESSITYVRDIQDMTPFIAATYAYLGEKEKAKIYLNKWIEGYVEGFYPDVQSIYYQYGFRNSEVFERFIEGLIKAGYKPKTTGYTKFDKNRKLTGEEIKKLLFGHTETGFYGGIIYSIDRELNGELVLALGQYKDKGISWIKNNQVCYKFEISYNGIEQCADIYINPGGDSAKKNEYIRVADYWYFFFSTEN